MRKFLFFCTLFIVLPAISQKHVYSRWSGTLEVGNNIIESDLMDTRTTVFDRLSHPSFGATLDYGIFPFLTVGMAYNNHYLQAKNSTDFFTTQLQQAYPYVEINVLNLLMGNKPTRFGVWLQVGYGVAGYTFANITDPNKINYFPGHSTPYYLNTPGGMAFVTNYGITLDYNISRSVSVGLKVERFEYSKDNLEGITQFNWAGVTNDVVNSALIQLRYKFGSPDKKQVRDCTLIEYFKRK